MAVACSGQVKHDTESVFDFAHCGGRDAAPVLNEAFSIGRMDLLDENNAGSPNATVRRCDAHV